MSQSKDDSMVSIDDGHRNAHYRTTAEWRQNKGFGVFSYETTIPTDGRTEREIEDEGIRCARQLWDVGKHIRVARRNWGEIETTLYLGFRLDKRPDLSDVEALYRLIKRIGKSSSQEYTLGSVGSGTEQRSEGCGNPASPQGTD